MITTRDELRKTKAIPLQCRYQRFSTLDIGESTMPDKVLSVLAAAMLLASVGVANAKDAKGPVELKDVQLDKVTAGASAANQTASLLATSTATLNRLVTISNFTVGFLNGVPQAPLPLSTFIATP
jgi:hypothetical protein